MKQSLQLAIVLGSLSITMARSKDELLAPLFKDLGHHHHKITTRYQLAQRYFDQGFTLLYNFNHAEAIRSFQAAAKIDPGCAMAFWGIAYGYGPNINAPMEQAAFPKAREALEKALALKDKTSVKEWAYIEALSKRYSQEPVKDRSVLDQAYADAMREVAKKYPNDLDAQTLFAEALMDTSPWNYWLPDLTPKPAAKEALAVIESVLSRVRSHPGADHFYIHLVEAGPNPEKGIRSADRLGALAPAAGHLVHMPSHIYARVGRYHEASTANERAIAADESYLNQCKVQGMYPGGYYPHNLHFLWYATTLEGRSRESIAAARKVSQYALDLRCGAIEGPRQRYLHLLAFARFGRWEDILKDREPAEAYPFDRAMWHYARGLAFAATGRADDAAQEHLKLQELEKSEKVLAMDNPYFPGTKILAIANQMLAGKVASARDQKKEALEHLQKAVQLEGQMPYMEPPYWYSSARQALGAALLKADQSSEAEKIFLQELKNLPNNGWPLFGLAQSLRSQGKIAEARGVENQLEKAWKPDVKLDLSWY